MFNSQDPDDSLMFKLSQVGGEYRLSRNFRLKEARSGCGADVVYVHPALLVLLQNLRDDFGRLRINSWYRSLEWNTKIQGERDSKHLWGMAVDVVPLDCGHQRFRDGLVKYDVGGIGIYKNFTHIDVFGKDRRW